MSIIDLQKDNSSYRNDILNSIYDDNVERRAVRGYSDSKGLKNIQNEENRKKNRDRLNNNIRRVNIEDDIDNHEDYNIKKYINNNYSFQLLTEIISGTINKGEKMCKVLCKIKNNGRFSWPKKTCLKSEKQNNKNIEIKFTELGEIKPGCQISKRITLNNLQNLEKDEYIFILYFTVNDKIYGEPICISLNVI